MGGGRGLADPALEIRDGRDLRRQALRAEGAVFLGPGALGGEMRPEPQDLVEGEPLGAGLGLGLALGQARVGAQNPAEMGGGDGDQVARDLPGREEAQGAPLGPAMAPGHEILPSPGTAQGEVGEILGADPVSEFGEGGVGRDAEIGGERRFRVL